MSDFKLDADGNLDLSTNDLQLVTGADAIAQHLLIRLRMFRGEWFLDRRIGIPYFQSILVKSPNLTAVRGIYRTAITSTPGVIRVEKFSLDFERSTRELQVPFSALLDGEEVARDFSEVFIL